MKTTSTARSLFSRSSGPICRNKPTRTSRPLPLPFLIPTTLSQTRAFHHSRAPQSSSNGSESLQAPQIPSRWLSDIKKRLGRCIIWGLTPEQTTRAGEILQVVARDWRELLAGSQGFLTEESRAGLLGHNVVWGEMDSMGHVNNVMYTRYAESARVNWIHKIGTNVDPANKQAWKELMTPRSDGLILRSIRTDYKFPMQWPDRISVFHKLRAAPSASADSFVLDVLIVSERHQRTTAVCEEDIVVYDYQQGQKTVMPEFMLNVFTETFKQQEVARVENSKRVLELLNKVEALEKDSWDRPDAVEDMGSAKK